MPFIKWKIKGVHMTADILAKGLANYFKRINGEATELDGLIRSLKTTDTSRVGMDFKECEFSPMKREDYYFPIFNDSHGYENAVWNDDPIDFNIKKAVGVYRTKEQAIEKAKELGWME